MAEGSREGRNSYDRNTKCPLKRALSSYLLLDLTLAGRPGPGNTQIFFTFQRPAGESGEPYLWCGRPAGVGGGGRRYRNMKTFPGIIRRVSWHAAAGAVSNPWTAPLLAGSGALWDSNNGKSSRSN